MSENQYILMISGTFDRSSSERIVRAIEESGRRHIVLDFSGISCSFAEGVEGLKTAILQGKTGSSTIEFVNIPEDLSVLFSVYGFASLRPVVPVPGNEEPPGQKTSGEIVCDSCGQTIRVAGPGMYGCPHCGSHFKLNHHNKQTHYECLRKLI